MTILIIILLTILLIGGFILLEYTDTGNSILYIIMSIYYSMLIVLILFENIQEETPINCLNNKNPYKIEIKYELKDSIYIPSDTIYIKIK